MLSKPSTEGPSVLYIDKHFIHEVTSPQAFKGLEETRTASVQAQTNCSHGRSQCAHRKTSTCPSRKNFHGCRFRHWTKTAKNLALNFMAWDIPTRELCM